MNIDKKILNMNDNIIAAKKIQEMLITNDPKNMPPNSLYINNTNQEQVIKTIINGVEENEGEILRPGDVLACGVNGEKWVIKKEDFKKLYEIVGNVAKSKPIKYFVLVYPEADIEWKNAWDETQKIPKIKDINKVKELKNKLDKLKQLQKLKNTDNIKKQIMKVEKELMNLGYLLMANSIEDIQNLNWKNLNPMHPDAFQKTYKIVKTNIPLMEEKIMNEDEKQKNTVKTSLQGNRTPKPF
jgi:hypothetical protein